jgi:hypothetical protein
MRGVAARLGVLAGTARPQRCAGPGGVSPRRPPSMTHAAFVRTPSPRYTAVPAPSRGTYPGPMPPLTSA